MYQQDPELVIMFHLTHAIIVSLHVCKIDSVTLTPEKAKAAGM